MDALGLPITECDEARLCVLSSSSKGNCTALVVSGGGRQGLILIDAGLSPRRTRELLTASGVDLPVSAIVLTHLDHDHFHPGWLGARSGLSGGSWLYLHKRHRSRAERAGALYSPTRVFEDECFEVASGVVFSPVLMSHDTLGAAAFRVDFAHSGRSLGFATDLGRATQRLVDHLSGVDVLAIESNYCPTMQAYSGRPEYLRRRITHGSGHLSNEQAAEAVRAIGPREHVVLLHLSLDCNRPEVAAMHHRGHACPVTISSWDRPTGWIGLTWRGVARRDREVSRPGPAVVTRRAGVALRTPTLWESVGAMSENLSAPPVQDT